MNRGEETRFRKGQSGNPAGRPRTPKPPPSAFDIVFDQTLTVKQNGVERELTVDEALQLQTYQAALKGNRPAIRAVLKMIEKREVALAKRRSPEINTQTTQFVYDADNADDALNILGVTALASPADPGGSPRARTKIATWAAQAAISRAGRRRLTDRDVAEIKRLTIDSDKLRWSRAGRP